MKIRDQGVRFKDRGKSKAGLNLRLRGFSDKALEKETRLRYELRIKASDEANRRAALKYGDEGD